MSFLAKPSLEDYDNRVRKFVKAATGVKHCFNANLDNPITDKMKEYATAALVMSAPIGSNCITYEIINDDKIYAHVSSTKRMIFTFNFYRSPRAMELAYALGDYAGSPGGIYYLECNNLTIWEVGQVHDLTSLQEGDPLHLEQRSSVDITFGVTIKYKQEFNTLLSAKICMEASSGETIVKSDILV